MSLAEQSETPCCPRFSPTRAQGRWSCKPSHKKRTGLNLSFLFRVVPRAGLEPARIAPHAPQTCAATNYATSADFQRNYLLAGALGGAEFASVVVAGSAAFAFVSGAVLALAAGAFELVLDGASAGASGFDERTET